MYISIIVPTLNRASLLDEALRSILNQDFSLEKFEVLVVDNGSIDQTKSVVDRYTNAYSNVRYIFAPQPGLHTGRHRGLADAQGDVLAFVDDDIEAFPGWLASIWSTFSDPNVVLVGGNNVPMFLADPPCWLLDIWNGSSYQSGKALPALSLLDLPWNEPRQISPYYIWGCNFSIRKEVLVSAGGFHPDGMPKDLIRFRGDGETHVAEYVAHSGWLAIFNPGVSVFHKVTPERMTEGYFVQRGFTQGVSESYTDLRACNGVSGVFGFLKVVRMVFYSFRKLVLAFFSGRKSEIVVASMLVAQCKGYLHHRAAYRADPEVKKWVHRDNYF